MSGLQEMTVPQRMLLQYEVDQFLYHEASLLDERKFEAWLALMADDIHYWMPIRRTTTAREIDREFTAPGAMAFFDDNKTFLTMRVKKMGAGNAWSEDPPSRTRHAVSNIRITAVAGNEITVQANFQLYRTRLASEEDCWIGRRQDVLRRMECGFLIARRHIFLEQTLITAQNMSNLF